MNVIFQQAFDLITQSPGNLIYHIVLAFSIAGALQAAFNFWQDHDYPQGRRLILGLSLLLATRIAVFSVAGLVNIGLLDGRSILPVLDRAVTALTILLIIWVWAYPERVPNADAATALLAIFIIILFIFTLVWWGLQYDETSFNATQANLGWEILFLILIVIGNRILFNRRANQWGYGFAMLGILAIGHLIHLVYPNTEADISGIVRFFEMASLPLLLTLPQRFNSVTILPPKIEQLPPQTTAKQPPDHQFFSDIFSLATTQSENELYQKSAKIIAETLLSDVCLIVSPITDDGKLRVYCGYDLIRETYFPKFELVGSQVPMLVSAMKRSRPLMLPASSTSLDLYHLGEMLNLGKAGHLLAAFSPSEDKKSALLGYILLSPYSDRRWNRKDQAYLNTIAKALALILQQKQLNQQDDTALEVAQQNAQSLKSLLDQVKEENASLMAKIQEFDIQRPQYSEKEVADLINLQDSTSQEIKRLRSENKRLDAALRDSAQIDENQVETEAALSLALSELAILKTQLAEADQQMLALRDQQKKPKSPDLPENQYEVFTAIVQELRQPMSSILGYTDLLLGESVGILGALQRKFLDRIKASTERMDALINDLFQVVSLDTGLFELQPETVNLEAAIDSAIVDTRNQFQERGIVLRVDFPDKMPLLVADHDALQQILIQLLKNAGNATPIDGEIFFRASIYKTDNDQDYALLQITDQGGGIPKEDLPRVFSRLYRADNPLIEGVGDSGVGLSIVKTLVEAHNGRIWVDTEEGVGATFNILLPLSHQQGSAQ